MLALIGYVVGAVVMSLYDYLFKTLEDPNFSWDHKYTVTMLLSILGAFITAILTFPNIQIPESAEGFVFASTVALGFTVNHLINKPVTYISKLAASTKKGS
jgi:hypothetical protein